MGEARGRGGHATRSEVGTMRFFIPCAGSRAESEEICDRREAAGDVGRWAGLGGVFLHAVGLRFCPPRAKQIPGAFARDHG